MIKRFKTNKNIIDYLNKYTIQYTLANDQRTYFISGKLYNNYEYEELIYLLNDIKPIYLNNETINVINPLYANNMMEAINASRIV